MIKNDLKMPMTKADMDALVQKYVKADKHEYPDYMAIGRGDNEVRYDYDSSDICYSLIRHFKPTNCLEFGTSFGHSTVFITDALLKNGLPFEFQAFEMMPDLYNKTKENLERRHGKLIPDLIMADITTRLDDIPDNLDFVFIDTNHEHGSTQWYVENIFPKIKKGGLVAIHDIAFKEQPDGKWISKEELGATTSTLEEMTYLRKLNEEGKLDLEKMYWMYDYSEEYPDRWEGSFWIKK